MLFEVLYIVTFTHQSCTTLYVQLSCCYYSLSNYFS